MMAVVGVVGIVAELCGCGTAVRQGKQRTRREARGLGDRCLCATNAEPAVNRLGLGACRESCRQRGREWKKNRLLFHL